MAKSAAQLDREIAAYLATREPYKGALGSGPNRLTDDEYWSIVDFLRKQKRPHTLFSGAIGVGDATIATPADAMRLGWTPKHKKR